jgi:hypothetical protein
LPSKNINIEVYRIINFPPVYHGCENSILTMREKHRLRVYESRVLRKMFRSMMEEVRRDWKRLCSQFFVISTPNQIILV